jgi:hypothetical protein
MSTEAGAQTRDIIFAEDKAVQRIDK